jgi:hypothetical protein
VRTAPFAGLVLTHTDTPWSRTARNNLGAAVPDTSHNVTVTVRGSNIITAGSVAVTVDPAPTGGPTACVLTPLGNDTVSCTVTFSSTGVGSYLVGALGAVTIDGKPVPVGTLGTDPSATGNLNAYLSSGPVLKQFSCLTQSVAFTIAGAGLSHAAYSRLVGGQWKVRVHHTRTGGPPYATLDLGPPVDQDGSPSTLGDLVFRLP